MAWYDVRDGNPVKRALADGETVVGSFIRCSSTEVVEACAHAGCAFVLIDLEHSSISWPVAASMIAAGEAAGTTPITRISNPTRDLVTRALDVGSHGVMVAQVESAETAAEVVAATRYGPGGTRGSALGRGAGWGMKMSLAEYQAAANDATFVAVQVESRRGVAAIEDIAGVEGVDCVFVGLSDLTVDHGVPGQPGAPEVQADLDRIHAACDAHGVPVGYPAPGSEAAKPLLERGARLIATGDVMVLAQAISAFVVEVSSFVE